MCRKFITPTAKMASNSRPSGQSDVAETMRRMQWWLQRHYKTSSTTPIHHAQESPCSHEPNVDRCKLNTHSSDHHQDSENTFKKNTPSKKIHLRFGTCKMTFVYIVHFSFSFHEILLQFLYFYDEIPLTLGPKSNSIISKFI